MSMATDRPAHLLRELTQRGDPVSLDEAATLARTTVEGASRALTHLAGRGDFVKVRQRLWVRASAPVDPYKLAARVTSPYALAYGTALALHGGSAVQRTEVIIAGPHRFESFEFEGVLYRHARPWIDDGLARVSVGPEFVTVTAPERTLVECVRVPANAGGVVEVLRGAGGLPPLQSDEVLRWVDRYGEANLAARLGFVLESADRPDQELSLLAQLERRRPSATAYLQRGRRGGRLLPRWNLIVPGDLLGPRGGTS